MENFFENLKYASTTMQAVGVTVGGLVGVFATLALFFVIIWAADKVGSRKGGH